MIPYGRQAIDEDDIEAVANVLRSDWLTTGPMVTTFEEALAEKVGAVFGVAVNSGTAALHAAMYALGIGPGDEVIVPAITFAATANSVVFQGGKPVFADVDPKTLLIDPVDVQAKINSRTRAIVAVDYAGQACDYDALSNLSQRYGVQLVADACHSLGGRYRGRPVGSLADLSVFSFHPVKHITTGEGGMITTDNPEFYRRMRIFRNHGITTEHRERTSQGSWLYEMVDLGFNYRISDILCALGLSQLKKLDGWVQVRRAIAEQYNEAFSSIRDIEPLTANDNVFHAYHLYVVLVDFSRLGCTRSQMCQALRDSGISTNVHYIPVHLHPFYRNRFGTGPGMCPVAENAYEKCLSLPMFPSMPDDWINAVIHAVRQFVDDHN